MMSLQVAISCLQRGDTDVMNVQVEILCLKRGDVGAMSVTPTFISHLCVPLDRITASTGLYSAYADISILSRPSSISYLSFSIFASHACAALFQWSHLQ